MTANPQPKRPMRVLGLHGWIPWRFVKRGASSTTWVLDFHGELEDFGVV